MRYSICVSFRRMGAARPRIDRQAINVPFAPFPDNPEDGENILRKGRIMLLDNLALFLRIRGGDVYFEIFNGGPKTAKKARKPLSGGAQTVDNLKLAIDV
ncbi:hypothetical protein KEH57_23625 [Burkholderia cenocepacia]|uniref:hypothetical protein n=1 Tax=Burkholderia cenocepacia TaxID=95486 RepID=UPI001BAD5940|nr:hypothetical protein [Burkholderia cenocepacia]QUO29469.1 hypothetical protein KEH57_23625 [Burkholderia cenocepacia]